MRFVSLGGIFDVNRDNVANSFRNAIQMVNMSNEALNLREILLLVDTNESFAVQKASELSICFFTFLMKIFQIELNFIAACNLVSQNVAAIFGPNSSRASGENSIDFKFNFKSIRNCPFD